MSAVHAEWLVVLLSLAAALAYGTSTSLKHVSAGHVPDAQDLSVRKLARLVRATLAHPYWLVAIGCDAVGLVLHVLALYLGTLAVVQPVLVTGLLFALVIRQRFEHYRISRRQVMWAAVLTAALAGFLLFTGDPEAPAPPAPDPIPAGVAGGLGVLAVAVLVTLGRRHRGSGRSATLLGVGVGIMSAGTAALLKVVSAIAARGPVALLVSWQLYVVVAVGGAGILLEQLAFQAGPITASVPAAVTADPLVSVLVGVTVFDEPIRHGLLAGCAVVVLLVVLAVSTVQIARMRAAPPDPIPAGDRPAPSGGRSAPPGGRGVAGQPFAPTDV